MQPLSLRFSIKYLCKGFFVIPQPLNGGESDENPQPATSHFCHDFAFSMDFYSKSVENKLHIINSIIGTKSLKDADYKIKDIKELPKLIKEASK
mgnify:CR=1 FL=1